MKLQSITKEEQQDLVSILKEREAVLLWRLATFEPANHTSLKQACVETAWELDRVQHMLHAAMNIEPVSCET